MFGGNEAPRIATPYSRYCNEADARDAPGQIEFYISNGYLIRAQGGKFVLNQFRTMRIGGKDEPISGLDAVKKEMWREIQDQLFRELSYSKDADYSELLKNFKVDGLPGGKTQELLEIYYQAARGKGEAWVRARNAGGAAEIIGGRP